MIRWILKEYKKQIPLDTEDHDIVCIPIDGVLDLHTFAPKEAASAVDEYVYACLEKGINEVKIIHGKGRGALRRKVHSVLQSHPLVKRFRLDPGPSGWGATIVYLKTNPPRL
jgi:dsDNA-specific endonuclease/ATPase MutS2